MTTELVLMGTLALAGFGGLAAAAMSLRELQRTLRDRDLFIRQLLDRLATHEYAKVDQVIPRIFATTPPSIKEEGVVGPHGHGQNTQVDLDAIRAEFLKEKRKVEGQKRNRRVLKVDTAEEFRRPSVDPPASGESK